MFYKNQNILYLGPVLETKPSLKWMLSRPTLLLEVIKISYTAEVSIQYTASSSG